MKLNFDAVVIGAGCAGITAAIYLKRANINVLMIDNNIPGGQINNASKIDNYPGVRGIDGPTLALNMYQQTKDLNIPFKNNEVLEINDYGDYKVVKTTKDELRCKIVIIATGRKPKGIELKKEKDFIGKGISWCAICDGPLYKNKNVIVVGGGNSALNESLFLTNFVKKVYLIHYKKEFRADNIIQEQIINHEKIKVILNARIIDIIDNNGVLEGVDIIDNATKKKKKIKGFGLFIYIGFRPNNKVVNNILVNKDDGYIVVDNNMRTNIPYIYACGDIIKKDLYQISTAVGEGAIAAFSAIYDLNKQMKENK